ncbi:MAG: hypothetical protein JXB34_10065, partial [Bacteroidales bacterium]|nr:hypothetical protein [Bacteroidales bacterium]
MDDIQLLSKLEEELNYKFLEEEYDIDVMYYSSKGRFCLNAENRIIALNLFEFKLDYFPEIIYRFKYLKKLNFNNNFLKTQPSKL